MKHMALGGSVALLAVAAGTAQAGLSGTFTEIHGQKVDGTSAFDTSISIPQFDDQAGTRQLVGVTLLLEFEAGSLVTAENDAAAPAPNFTLNLAGTVHVAFGDFDRTDGLYKSMVESVGATDGIANSGPDFMDYGNVLRRVTTTTEQTTGLSAYSGTGTLGALINAEAAFSYTGTSDATIRT
ncbi:MAG: choice-of-anchor E domain-containing protein, partial [Phycisphaerales bacterium]|nr:choice-of-anchor E domain-containing protein [Phycisphaerales bacterium]